MSFGQGGPSCDLSQDKKFVKYANHCRTDKSGIGWRECVGLGSVTLTETGDFWKSGFSDELFN